MIDGFLNINKDSEITSNRCISILKRVLQIKKIGFVGTLDPFACGVLPVALGKGTRLINYGTHEPKVYEFDVCWGVATDSYDRDGEVTQRCELIPNAQQINDVLRQFIGKIEQIPPKYSAIKIGGRRACDMMRAGNDVTIPARIVDIKALHMVSHDGNVTRLQMKCGPGTYVRSLAVDIAAKLNTVAHVQHLRRMRAGNFSIENAITIKELDNMGQDVLLINKAYVSLVNWLDDIPAVRLYGKQALDFCTGIAVNFDIPNTVNNDMQYKALDDNHELLGIGLAKDNMLLPKRIVM